MFQGAKWVYPILVTVFTAFAIPFFTYAEEIPQPTEIIVKFKEEKIDLGRASGDWRSERLADYEGVEIVDSLIEQNISVVVPTDGETIEEAINELESNPAIEYAEPNLFREILSADTRFNEQWSLKNIGQNGWKVDADIDIEEAWNISDGNTDEVIVAVIDTGVKYDHPDLINQMWDGSSCVNASSTPIAGGCLHGYDFYNNDNDPYPTTSFHGTQVSGIIGAERGNGQGIAGIAPNVKIMALKTDFFYSGDGKTYLSLAAELKAIDFAIANGAKIINGSFGSTGFSQAEYNALTRFQNAGGIFIAASGNEYQDSALNPVYPSDYDLPSIISVAATNQNDLMPNYSSYNINSVDLGAPGHEILSTRSGYDNGQDYSYAPNNGTSFAAPHVAGVAALMWGYRNDLTPAEIKNIILTTGDSIPALNGKTVSGKRLNAWNAMKFIEDKTAPIININTPTATTSSIVNWSPNISWGDSEECFYKFDFTDFVKGGWQSIDCNNSIPSPTGGYRTLFIKGVDTYGNAAEKSASFVFNPSYINLSMATIMKGQISEGNQKFDDYTLVLKAGDYGTTSVVKNWKLIFTCSATANIVKTGTSTTNLCTTPIIFAYNPDEHGQEYFDVLIGRNDTKLTYVNVRRIGLDANGNIVGDVDNNISLAGAPILVPVVSNPDPVDPDPVFESSNDYLDEEPTEPSPSDESEIEEIEDEENLEF